MRRRPSEKEKALSGGAAGSLDIDKADIAPYDDFINREIEGLLIRAQAAGVGAPSERRGRDPQGGDA